MAEEPVSNKTGVEVGKLKTVREEEGEEGGTVLRLVALTLSPTVANTGNSSSRAVGTSKTYGTVKNNYLVGT